ncbi:MAG: ChrR family anti-sigma-E factor [Alphaproteobacteria bacterium]|nr:ChrR family anti-sigma-E factor [Alphaproteobacteria bacterium]
MKGIHHHISNETLASYASGSLSDNLSFVVATHLSLCPKCQSRLHDLEHIGAIELEDGPNMAMSDGCLDNIFAMIDVDDSVEKHMTMDTNLSSKPYQKSDDSRINRIPAPLRETIGIENFSDLDNLDWKFMAPGIKQVALPEGSFSKGNLRLINIEPGHTIPEHGHSGAELTMILKGSYSDEVGRFKVGDIADLDNDAEHQPIADNGENCICLIATEAPLVFKSILPRLVQPFIGL